MVRRISVSQYNSMVRQAQAKQRDAIRKYNQAVDNYNRELKRGVDNYNREVRAHNSRVRAHRSKLENAIRRLEAESRKPVRITQTVRSRTVYEAYGRVNERYEAGHYSERFNEALDFAEREVANSVELEASLARAPDESEQESALESDPELLDGLQRVGDDLAQRWQGALFALSPRNPDAARHFCTSAREIFVQMLDYGAPDKAVRELGPSCETTSEGSPTRRSKIRFMLAQKSLSDPSFEDFVDTDIENILSLFRVFNDGTHGSAGKFGFSQLRAIKVRVEDGIKFLSLIASRAN